MTSVAVIALVAGLAGPHPAAAQVPPVGLGTAASFAVLGGQTVTNTGPSVILGSVGVSPGDAVTGFPPGTVIGGTIHVANAVAAQAQLDLTTAYNDAAGRGPVTSVGADLTGQTLVAGVYGGGTLGLTGTVTLDAQGDPNAVWVFQAASTLITGSGSVVALINGASSCNVYWQVGSSATLGTGSSFVGTVMALTSISATTGATIQGRLLARNGATTLDNNTINSSVCAIGPTVPPITAPPTTAPPTGPPATGPGGTAPGGGDTTVPALPIPAPPPPGPGLPVTGSSHTTTVAFLIGALAVAAGGALQLSMRIDRRRRTDR